MMQKIVLGLGLVVALVRCNYPEAKNEVSAITEKQQGVELVVLGIAQDAGFPQAGCEKVCCKAVWDNPESKLMVSSLGLIDHESGQCWLFDATPDFPQQLQDLTKAGALAGIFLTHAHIGHYTGLMHLGREVMGAKQVPVFAMPRMEGFLQQNGPWSQLVNLGNISIQQMKADSAVLLNGKLNIIPLLVPHRDEFSETVGFLINGPEKQALFIPDIDKWNKWNKNIVEWIKQVDYAFLDGTFYKNGEIPGRDMSEIPHPFIEESMALFMELPTEERSKIHFIHFNHTNPLLQAGSQERLEVENAGFQIAEQGARIEL